MLPRLPGPLALVQTDGAGSEQTITHINGLSLADLPQRCPELPPAEAAAASGGGGAGSRVLTAMSRSGVTVRGLTVVLVHAGLLAPARGAAAVAGAADEERRALQRAAARLTWGLAGIVFELVHSHAGHWPALGSATDRQYVAGAALEQLFRCGLALLPCSLFSPAEGC